jgi:hypothetical protein
MNVIRNFAIVFFIVVIASCKFNETFDSFKPIHCYELLGDPNKLDSGYLDNDSNIIFSMTTDTFQVHFDIVKKKGNNLIFSTNKTDTVGNLSIKTQLFYFNPKDK